MPRSCHSSIPVIDLFAGPGGLSEGFSRHESAGRRKPFRIALSIEKDPFAYSTLRLRSFYRSFAPGRAPGKYYDVVRGQASIKELFDAYPEHAVVADQEAWKATLGVVSNAAVKDRITAALEEADPWVLIGGPPCQAYSIAGRARNKGVKGYTPEDDHRQYLYVEYLQTIAASWPAVFVMENVKGLLSASLNNQHIFDRILEDLESPADALKREGRSLGTKRNHKYRVVSLDSRTLFETVDVGDYLVFAERHGVPQARHRIILLGIRDDLGDVSVPWLRSVSEIPSRGVLDKLPKLRSGLSSGDSPQAWVSTLRDAVGRRWLASASRIAGPEVAGLIVETVSKLKPPENDRGARFMEGDFTPIYRPDWYSDGRLGGICQHETRAHLASDLHRYLFVSSFGRVWKRSPRLREFPKDLLPAHDNVSRALGWGNFNDRFRVQLRDRPASTITSHISKDGHYYIHHDPAQCRSLTLREAARLQTFPDNYYFTGPRTAGYAQVGNAVPPLLAEQIAEVVYNVLCSAGAGTE